MSKHERERSRAARAAAVQQAQVKRERARRLIVTLAVVTVLAVIVIVGVVLTGGKDPAPGGGKLPVAVEGQALVLGEDADATKVVIYEDFLCPYCRELEVAARELLHSSAASGQAVVEYRPFQLLQDDYSLESLTAWAAVLENGTPEQALEFHDLLFDNQPYEAAQDKPGVEELVDLAEEAGVDDQDALDAIGQQNPEFVEATSTTAREAGIRSTPTVLVDGQEVEGQSIAEIVSQLEELLDK